jgi:uncharacterized protein YkwD
MIRTLPLLAVVLVAAADEFKLSEDEKAVVELTNAERKKADLPPLKPDARLFAAARGHAANMAKQDKLEHDLDGKSAADRVADAGYKAGRSGENIGWNFPTPKAAVAGWMDSTAHKENILNADYTAIGVAVAKNEKGEPYWVQVFAAPAE